MLNLCHTYVFYPARMRSARPTIICQRVATPALVLLCSRTYTYLQVFTAPWLRPKHQSNPSTHTKIQTPNKLPPKPRGLCDSY